jgi:D-sedoheptulose 7-phosphate isomerase
MIDRDTAIRRTQTHLLASGEVKRRVADLCTEQIVRAASAMLESLRQGGKIMLCGNGGSAADAQHIAAEFTNRLRPEVQRPALAALALTTDSSFLTAHANDYAFETVFQRQVEALGREEDILLAISTSGNSRNLLCAVESCRGAGIATTGLLGGHGGRLRELVDLAIVVPSEDTQHIQEAHIAIGHILVDLIEWSLIDGLVGFVRLPRGNGRPSTAVRS